jgi:hypothetical protein
MDDGVVYGEVVTNVPHPVRPMAYLLVRTCRDEYSVLYVLRDGKTGPVVAQRVPSSVVAKLFAEYSQVKDTPPPEKQADPALLAQPVAAAKQARPASAKREPVEVVPAEDVPADLGQDEPVAEPPAAVGPVEAMASGEDLVCLDMV